MNFDESTFMDGVDSKLLNPIWATSQLLPPKMQQQYSYTSYLLSDLSVFHKKKNAMP
jgi:hypothetical protein